MRCHIHSTPNELDPPVRIQLSLLPTQQYPGPPQHYSPEWGPLTWLLVGTWWAEPSPAAEGRGRAPETESLGVERSMPSRQRRIHCSGYICSLPTWTSQTAHSNEALKKRRVAIRQWERERERDSYLDVWGPSSPACGHCWALAQQEHEGKLTNSTRISLTTYYNRKIKEKATYHCQGPPLASSLHTSQLHWQTQNSPARKRERCGISCTHRQGVTLNPIPQWCSCDIS